MLKKFGANNFCHAGGVQAGMKINAPLADINNINCQLRTGNRRVLNAAAYRGPKFVTLQPNQACMNPKKLTLFLSLVLVFSLQSFAQPDSLIQNGTAPKVGILIPLHLDSVFKSGSYKYGNNVPKFLLPGLEFYNGVQLALDSLNEEGVQAEVFIIDSRKNGNYSNALKDYQLNGLSLLIGVAQSAPELKAMADAAQKKNIPFISATYPNDGGITSAPGLVIVNSTLRTHVHSMYKYLQRYHNNDNLVVLRKPGAMEDRIKSYLVEAEKAASGMVLKFKYTDLTDSFRVSDITRLLDSTRTNVIVTGSLDDAFDQRVLKVAAGFNKKYPSHVFGMPTWDDYNLTKPEFKGLDVYYSTPFISFSANSKVYNSIAAKFKKLASSRPSDMVYKGFEVTYRFIKTLAEEPGDFMKHINDRDYRLFAEFDFQPVYMRKSDEPDYVENKKVYFIKKTDGVVKTIL